MMVLARCGQGHEWEVEGAVFNTDDETLVMCPVCGQAGLLLSTLHEQEFQNTSVIDGASSVRKPAAKSADQPHSRYDPSGEWHRLGYEILGFLGRGGMGVVYSAQQSRLNRPVALKMIHAHISPQDAAYVRFQAEAEAVAQIHHPNIVQIYEIGEYNDFPFFSLELVSGGTLAQKMRNTTFTPRQAAQLVETMARAMHCAHQKGLIHRELKPGNILLTEDGTP